MILKSTRILVFASAFAASLYGQTKLTSGEPVPFELNTVYLTIGNGPHGYVIPVPSTPFEMTVQVQIAPFKATLAIYGRCGSDISVPGNEPAAAIFDTVAYTVNGTASLFLAQPAANTDQNCYIALSALTQGVIGGRLIATIQALPKGSQVSVPSLASIYLAGQPGGTQLGELSAPANSPPQAPVSLTAGQGLNILAAGHIGGTGPEGSSNPQGQGLSAAFGLSQVKLPPNGLLGVFVGGSIDSSAKPLGLNFSSGDLVNAQTLYPLLQQVFYVGNGVNASGQARVFVVPAGATRLFLASASGGFNVSGTVVASVFPAAIPATPATTNPMVIPSAADLFMVDQPNGTEVPIPQSQYAGAIMPSSAPLQVPIILSAGQSLNIFGFASISTGGGEGLVAGSGISTLQLIPGLAGVFVADTIDRTTTPSPVPPNENTLSLAPHLQQAFFIGTGYTSKGVPRSFTVPSGATRLFLASTGGSFGATGFAPAVVTVEGSNGPEIGAGGIVSNAGFTAGAVAPGSMVAIFGSNFGPASTPNSVPLPTNLGDTQVFFNNVPAPLFYVSPGQLVAQVPFEMYGLTKALVTVVHNGIVGLPQAVSLTPFAPAIFTTGTGDPVITDANTGKLVSTSAPASRGDTIILWATGLGPTLLDPPTGHAAPEAISPTLLPIQVIFKGAASGAQEPGVVAYAGLAPGFIGLDQINVQIPETAPTGTVIVELQSPSLGAAKPVTIGMQ